MFKVGDVVNDVVDGCGFGTVMEIDENGNPLIHWDDETLEDFTRAVKDGLRTYYQYSDFELVKRKEDVEHAKQSNLEMAKFLIDDMDDDALIELAICIQTELDERGYTQDA